MTFTLCATCNKAIFSWETPSLLPGLKPSVEWTHYVRCDLADPESGVHDAVPPRTIRERKLFCAVCRQPQRWYGPMWGWMCGNHHCFTNRVDKD